MKEFTLRYKTSQVKVQISPHNFLYAIKPKDTPGLKDEKQAIKESLSKPTGSPPLSDQVKQGMKVVIIGDDITRPTPRERIIPVLLDELNHCGIQDKDITVLIALGTHRYMTEQEILQCYGREVIQRVTVINHEWQDENNLIKMEQTPSGTPISINKIAYEADYLIALGSIVPHCIAGYGGGGKAIQPGICSWETTGRTHLLPMKNDKFLTLAGDTENEIRIEMEKVAEMVGLDFICNVVLNEKKEIVYVASGDQVKAHREGVKVAKEIYERKIPGLADIIIVSAYPAHLDYWQGAKPLSYAQHGIKKGGTTIFLGAFPDGISPTHTELREHARKSYAELKKSIQEDVFEDLVGAFNLLQHAQIMEHTSEVICISDGLSREDKEKLGFKHAEKVQEALDIALKKHGENAQVGVIDYGGDVLPIL